jgi:hypothetical protein
MAESKGAYMEDSDGRVQVIISVFKPDADSGLALAKAVLTGAKV